MKIELTGKRALVCGSTQGIGLAIAHQFAEMGADVTLLARNEESLKTALNTLPAHASQHHSYIVADFSEPDQVRQNVEIHLAKVQNFHILVNNTGGPAPGAVHKAKPEDFLKAITQHLFVSQNLVQCLLPGMRDENYGRIINIISTSVKQPIEGLGVSNTVRGAMASWSKTLSHEVAEFGITVNNILPGATTTERLAQIIINKAKNNSVEESSVEKIMLEEIPAKRFGKPEEIAYLAGFLASDFAGYITGTSIAVDGGRTRCL
ncbi:MAG: SDR family oxidoreductase [Bacteroidota bacterium]